MARVVVIGSANIDYVIKVERLPERGETVSDGRFFKAFGGKGANQAVSARLMGAEVTFIGCVGKDYEGKSVLENLQAYHINVTPVVQSSGSPTGRAFIFVDENGNNMIAVAPGANRDLSGDHVKKHADLIENADIVLAQLEVPLDAILTAFKIAFAKGITTILNPAPAYPVPPELMEICEYITPNRLEAEFFTGVHISDRQSAERAAMELAKQGVPNVIITMGEKGCFFFNYEKAQMIEGFHVKSTDTTGAGDAFNGALAVCVAEGMSIEKSLVYANAAGALATTREGAISSLPSREKVEALIQKETARE